MSTFQVLNERKDVILETDDWVDALMMSEPPWPLGRPRHLRGTHPTHSWGPPHEGQTPPCPRCEVCGAWDNTSYGSAAPCGYDFQGSSLQAALGREVLARKAAAGEEPGS